MKLTPHFTTIHGCEQVDECLYIHNVGHNQDLEVIREFLSEMRR